MKRNQKIAKLLETIIKSGLNKYKMKNSKATLPARVAAEKQDAQHKKGAVFMVRDKSHFTANGVKGYIVTSLETLLEDYSGVTHWTPNTFKEFTYSDDNRAHIKGFEERNLRQINTFVVDIDTKRHSLQAILLACIDESIGAPTFVVETERGYQLYFVLDAVTFVSNKRNYLNLKIAKRISENIKRSLSDIDADFFCNDFGFFRMPNENNVVYSNVEQTYSFETLMQWSRRQDDDANRPLFVLPSKKAMQVSASDSEWFAALLQATDIKGAKGRIGRNNAMFTLALALMSEGKDDSYAFDVLDEYNSRLTYPLKTNEIRTLVNSAYSGKYEGAKKEYIEELLAEYVSSDLLERGFKVQTCTNWYKHKKARAERVRSHLHEWEQDLIDYINGQAKNSTDGPFICRTQKQWCEALGMASSTFNKLLNESSKIVRRATGKGRGAATALTTVALLVRHALETISSVKADYRIRVQQLVDELYETAGKQATIHYLTELRMLESATDRRFANVDAHRLSG